MPVLQFTARSLLGRSSFFAQFFHCGVEGTIKFEFKLTVCLSVHYSLFPVSFLPTAIGCPHCFGSFTVDLFFFFTPSAGSVISSPRPVTVVAHDAIGSIGSCTLPNVNETCVVVFLSSRANSTEPMLFH